jgi:hypothetical protein
VERAKQQPTRPRKPADLDAEVSKRWEQQCSELDRGLAEGNAARARRALAMLERLRYGSR